MASYFDYAIVLMKDVPNPAHDKRRRYGSQSVASFEAGSVFYVTHPRDEHMPPTLYDRDGQWLDSVVGDTGKALMAASHKLDSLAWQEQVVLEFGALHKSDLHGAISELIKHGVITAEQVLAAIRDAQPQ